MYLVGVRPVLVFGSVRGVGEGLVAAFVLADIRFLAGVRAQVCFEILQAGVGLRAALELQGSRKENNVSLMAIRQEPGSLCNIADRQYFKIIYKM